MDDAPEDRDAGHVSHLAALIQESMDERGMRQSDFERAGDMPRGRLSWFLRNRLKKIPDVDTRRQLGRAIGSQRRVDEAIALDVGLEIGRMPYVDPLEGLSPRDREFAEEFIRRLHLTARNEGKTRRRA